MAFDDLFLGSSQRLEAPPSGTPRKRRSMSLPPSLLLDSFPDDLSVSDLQSPRFSRYAAPRVCDSPGVCCQQEANPWSSLFPIFETVSVSGEEDDEGKLGCSAPTCPSEDPVTVAQAWGSIEEKFSREVSPPLPCHCQSSGLGCHAQNVGAKRQDMQRMFLDRFPSYPMEEATKRQRSLPTIPERTAVWPLGSPSGIGPPSSSAAVTFPLHLGNLFSLVV